MKKIFTGNACKPGFLALTVLALTMGSVFAQFGGPSQVRLEKVALESLVDQITLSGNVEPVRESTVASEVSGRVEEVFADVGDSVEQGDVLIRIRDTSAAFEVERLEAEVRSLQAKLDELLAGYRLEDIRAAEAAAEEAEAQYLFAKQDEERLKRLLEEGAASQEEYDRAQTALKRARAVWQRLQATADRLKSGPREEEIAAARANLASEKARLASARDLLERYQVKAPFDGVISEKMTEVGEWAVQGAAMFRLTDSENLRAKVKVPELWFNMVDVGSPVLVRVDTLSDGDIEAKISRKVARADYTSRSFPILINLAGVNSKLAPGMMARITFSADVIDAPPQPVVPKDALVITDTGVTVWKAVEDEEGNLVAVPVPVEIGRRVRGMVEVQGDLDAGDRIITRGNERLAPNTIVIPEEPEAAVSDQPEMPPELPPDGQPG